VSSAKPWEVAGGSLLDALGGAVLEQEAPKRAMSAFLYFSQMMRPMIKTEYQELKNTGTSRGLLAGLHVVDIELMRPCRAMVGETDISKVLAERWRNASKEEKHPYIEREKIDRYVAEKPEKRR
jgi:hypothetical protein